MENEKLNIELTLEEGLLLIRACNSIDHTTLSSSMNTDKILKVYKILAKISKSILGATDIK